MIRRARDNSYSTEYLLGQAAGNGLEPPALSITDVTSSPENNRSDDPCPEKLPKNGRPPMKSLVLPLTISKSHAIPFPATTRCRLLLHVSSMDPCPGNAERRMELARNQEHEQGQEHLSEVSADDEVQTRQHMVDIMIVRTWKPIPSETSRSILLLYSIRCQAPKKVLRRVIRDCRSTSVSFWRYFCWALATYRKRLLDAWKRATPKGNQTPMIQNSAVSGIRTP
jgi:hypothetical protein